MPLDDEGIETLTETQPEVPEVPQEPTPTETTVPEDYVQIEDRVLQHYGVTTPELKRQFVQTVLNQAIYGTPKEQPPPKEPEKASPEPDLQEEATDYLRHATKKGVTNPVELVALAKRELKSEILKEIKTLLPEAYVGMRQGEYEFERKQTKGRETFFADPRNKDIVGDKEAVATVDKLVKAGIDPFEAVDTVRKLRATYSKQSTKRREQEGDGYYQGSSSNEGGGEDWKNMTEKELEKQIGGYWDHVLGLK